MVVTGDIMQYTKDNIPSNGIISITGIVKLGISYNEKDSFFQQDENKQYKEFTFKIYKDNDEQNYKIIQIGKTDIYELTQPIYIYKIEFGSSFPDSIKIDIVYYDKEGEQ